jgi:hypothetical protein
MKKFGHFFQPPYSADVLEGSTFWVRMFLKQINILSFFRVAQ